MLIIIQNMFYKLIKKIISTTISQLIWISLFFCAFVALWTILKHESPVKPQILDIPVILWWTEGFPGTFQNITCANGLQCKVLSGRGIDEKFEISAYLFYGSNIDFNDLPFPRNGKEIIWGLYHEESPRNVAELMHDPVLKLFNYSSTFSRYSDVPFPLQYLEEFGDITDTKYFINTSQKNGFRELAPILYLQTDCDTSTERDEYVKELMKLIQIDSYGECLNNKELDRQFKDDYLNNLNEDSFLKFIARYKFVLALENGICEDYITEKFWRAIKIGTVPIYFGSPSIRDWMPNNNSAVLLHDYPSPAVMKAHLEKLMGNDELYDQYLDHKTKRIITNEKLKREFWKRPKQNNPVVTVNAFQCLVCEKLHDKIKGVINEKVVDRNHYYCPKPISALTLKVNPTNPWVYAWESGKTNAKQIYAKSISNL